MAVELFERLLASLGSTLWDVLPIILVVLGFQRFVLRRPINRFPQVMLGFVLVTLGLAVFLVGLEVALFPIGTSMAEQLANPDFLATDGTIVVDGPDNVLAWTAFGWTYAFGFCIGFSATIAEPSLLAVAIKANHVSGGAIHVWGLRVAVALGSGFGVLLGTLRIVLGIPLPAMIITGYSVVLIQTFFAPKAIVPLAYDSGGVTTSTVTVPLVAALGVGLATQIPGRDPLVDGFGMIALAVLFPMISVMTYAQLARWWSERRESLGAGGP